MSTHLNYLERPKLKKPKLIAGLPGIAYIGKLAVDYLIHELRAQKFAELYSEHFPEWAIHEDGMIKMLKMDFYYCRPEELEDSLILATADAQAASPFGQYKLSGEILDFAMQYGVDTVITMAAYVLSPNESRSRIVGTATDAETAKLLNKHGIELLDGGTIVGMNGLLPALAGIRGLKGFCLLGVTRGGIVDVAAAEAVLEGLSSMLGLKLDLTDIHKYAMVPPKFKPLKLELPFRPEEEISYIR
jgi:uncharacterized protein (TIGR00162 family)